MPISREEYPLRAVSPEKKQPFQLEQFVIPELQKYLELDDDQLRKLFAKLSLEKAETMMSFMLRSGRVEWPRQDMIAISEARRQSEQKQKKGKIPSFRETFAPSFPKRLQALEGKYKELFKEMVFREMPGPVLEVFSGMDLDSIESWHDIVKSCIPEGYTNEVFEFITSKNLNEIESWSHALASCAKNGPGQEIAKIFAGKKIEHLQMWTVLIHTCVYNGGAQEIMKLFSGKTLQEITPWRGLLIACASHGAASEVADLVIQENLDDLRPWLDLLKSLSQPEAAKKIAPMFSGLSLEELEKWQYILDSYASNAPKQVFSLLESYSIDELEPWVDTVERCARSKEVAPYVLTKLEGRNLSELTEWRYVLKNCADAGYHDRVLAFFETKAIEELGDWFDLLVICALNGGESKVFSIYNPDQLQNNSQWMSRLKYFANTPSRSAQVLALINRTVPPDSLFEWDLVLEMCVNNGLANEVEEFLIERGQNLDDWVGIFQSYQYIPASTKHELKKSSQQEQRIEVRDILLSHIERDISFLGRNREKEKVLTNIKELLDELTLPELVLMSVIVKKHTFFHPRVQKMIQLDRFVVEINKTGSKLYIMKPEKEGQAITFVNEITQSAAEAWKKAHDAGIPCAPYLSDTPRGEKKVRVFSRFSGLDVYNIKGVSEETAQKIEDEQYRIKTIIRSMGITHGHTHDGNFVIELVKKDYFKEQKKIDSNINNIEWHPDHFSYNINDYEQNPNEWELVVRLIDFDRARHMSLSEI